MELTLREKAFMQHDNPYHPDFQEEEPQPVFENIPSQKAIELADDAIENILANHKLQNIYLDFTVEELMTFRDKMCRSLQDKLDEWE